MTGELGMPGARSDARRACVTSLEDHPPGACHHATIPMMPTLPQTLHTLNLLPVGSEPFLSRSPALLVPSMACLMMTNLKHI